MPRGISRHPGRKQLLNTHNIEKSEDIYHQKQSTLSFSMPHIQTIPLSSSTSCLKSLELGSTETNYKNREMPQKIKNQHSIMNGKMMVPWLQGQNTELTKPVLKTSEPSCHTFFGTYYLSIRALSNNSSHQQHKADRLAQAMQITHGLT